jgi:hypothetical protein
MGEAKRRYYAQNGVVRDAITDPDRPGQLIVHTRQDVEPILDSIKRDREIMPMNGYNKLAARIPQFLYEDLVHRGIANDEDALAVWLDSDEARPWRIWQGRIR